MPGKSYQKQMTMREYEDHMRRISSMKSVVDSKPPRISKLDNKKKDIERRRRYEHIEMDNRLLLERLVKTMQTKTIDNENKSCKKYSKSLISTSRKLELQRITQENQRLLKRIQETEPCYNHLIWEEEAKKREIYKRNMSEFQEATLPGGTGSAAGGWVTSAVSGQGNGMGGQVRPPRAVIGASAGSGVSRNKSAGMIRRGNDSTYSSSLLQETSLQSQHHQQQQFQQQDMSSYRTPPVAGSLGKLRPLSAPRPRMSSSSNEFI
jgi:hypothetical protein